MTLTLISLLMLKHFIFDFPLQTSAQIENKGKYANFTGFTHSLYHGLATAMVFVFFTPYFALLALIDLLTHYHIDWVKMRFGCQDFADRRFWTHLGLDQLLHGLNYVALVALYLWCR